MLFLHPDFQHGRSPYFDVSVCSTIQPVFISSSASCAGVAAAAGEVAKDEKHLAVPLVVECFGVWTPFALKMLKVIADCTTPRSGVPPKLAGKNLLQQLSVALWQSNAKIVLKCCALQDSDDDNNPLYH